MATTTNGRQGAEAAHRSGDCVHARGHISDSHFYGNNYATPASRRIFCDVCRVQRWLDVEVALAEAQADLGMIPAEAARDIASAACADRFDLDAIREEVMRSRHSLVGLLRVFQEACPNDSGQYVHYGATTQDIQDTAQSLEMRDVLDELEEQLRTLVQQLTDLAEEHATTIALGRTHARPALPISFGLKVASWVDELLRHVERIDEMRPRVLVAELFGGVGTMAGFQGRGPEVLGRFAQRLGLHAPLIAWHPARDRVVEFCTTLAAAAGTFARIADEVRTLSRPEFAEMEEAWRYGVVGSSTMPHKRNPERLEQVVVMGKLAGAQVVAALGALVGDHERDSRALRVEWACVPDVSHFTLAGCTILNTVLDGIIVHVDQLEANARAVADQIASESLMLMLADRIGKANAHDHVYRLTQVSFETKRALRDVIPTDPEVLSVLSAEEIAEALRPESYMGESQLLTRTVVAKARSWLATAEVRA